MKIIVTGAIGHIGSYIIRDLGSFFPKSTIVMIDNMMTQRFPSLFNLPSGVNYQFIEGDVSQMNLKSIFTGADAVIHLAGENIAARRWSAKQKQEICKSRVYRTRKLCESLAALSKPPSVLLAASATGFYGNSDCRLIEHIYVNDSSGPKNNFRTACREESGKWAMIK